MSQTCCLKSLRIMTKEQCSDLPLKEPIMSRKARLSPFGFRENSLELTSKAMTVCCLH